MPSSRPQLEPRNRSSGRSCLLGATLFFSYLFASAVLLMLPTGFIGAVFVGGGFLFFCVIGAHYFLWGRWLSQMLADEAQREADSSEPPPE